MVLSTRSTSRKLVDNFSEYSKNYWDSCSKIFYGPTLVRLPREVGVAGVAGADVGGAAGPANLEL